MPVLGSAVPAVLIGLALGPLARRLPRLEAGIGLARGRVLQISVVLLGAQLSLGEIAAVGLESLPVMLATLSVCLLAAWAIGRWLRITGDLTTLIGVGTGICGASAIAAIAPVIGAASAEVAYAVATIFLFNILAVLLFPALGHLLGMSEHSFGLFAGTAVNDTSSVVAAAAVFGGGALGFAVVVKLVRTLMILPISVGLAVLVARRDRASGAERARPSGALGWLRFLRLVPWFLVGFLLVAAAGSLGLIPEPAQEPLREAAVALIAAAMAGIGLSADPAAMRRAGLRPLLLGLLLSCAVTGTALLTLWLTGAL